MPRAPGPVGAVLAGGLGRRIGGDKALVSLAGRPLISYGLAALREALGSDPVVVAKWGTELPELPAGVEVWIEPDEPRHPLTGIVHALEQAAGRDVLVLAVDLPLVGAEVLRQLVEAASEPPGGGSVVACAAGRVQPLCGLYAAAALPALRGVKADVRLTDVVDALGASALRVAGADVLLNVNTARDVRRAESRLSSCARAWPGP